MPKRTYGRSKVKQNHLAILFAGFGESSKWPLAPSMIQKNVAKKHQDDAVRGNQLLLNDVSNWKFCFCADFHKRSLFAAAATVDVLLAFQQMFSSNLTPFMHFPCDCIVWTCATMSTAADRLYANAICFMCHTFLSVAFFIDGFVTNAFRWPHRGSKFRLVFFIEIHLFWRFAVKLSIFLSKPSIDQSFDCRLLEQFPFESRMLVAMPFLTVHSVNVFVRFRAVCSVMFTLRIDNDLFFIFNSSSVFTQQLLILSSKYGTNDFLQTIWHISIIALPSSNGDRLHTNAHTILTAFAMQC